MGSGFRASGLVWPFLSVGCKNVSRGLGVGVEGLGSRKVEQKKSSPSTPQSMDEEGCRVSSSGDVGGFGSSWGGRGAGGGG